MNKQVLILLGDCPGHYQKMMYSLSQRIIGDGGEVIVAATSRYYEKYNDLDFSSIGVTYYVSDFLKQNIKSESLDEVEIDYWWAYPTYIRDRYFFKRHRNDWEVYKKEVLFFQEIFSKNNISLVVSEPASNSFLYVGYRVATAEDIKYLGYLSARIPRHINIFLDPYGETMLEHIKAPSMSDTQFKGPPDYVGVHNRKLLSADIFQRIWRFLRFAHLNSVETGNTALHQLNSIYKRYVWRKLRYERARISGVFSSEVEWEGKTTVLYPLPFRPESSTSVLAKYYESDLEIIKNIAFSLPSNSQLIVKEHEPATGMRDFRFYKDVLGLPNTVLLSPHYNLSKNLAKFDAVVVLSSTVGFEASQLGVPVLLLGRVFFSEYAGVTRIDSFLELEDTIRSLRKTENIPNGQPMQEYKKFCFPGQFNYLSDVVLAKSNIENLYRPIKQVLGADDGN